MTERNEKHGALHRAVDKAADTVGGMVGRASANTAGSHSAGSFVESAALGDMYEIAAGKVALQHARSEKVKEAAGMMVEDHTASTERLRAALQASETPDLPGLPDSIDAGRKSLLDHLQATPAEAFDRMYVDQQVLAHKETVDLMTGYRDAGDDPALRSYAAETAEVVERHLAHMEQLKADFDRGGVR